MTEWTRLIQDFKRALIAHVLAAYPTKGASARALGMDPSDFRRVRRRLRHQPPKA